MDCPVGEGPEKDCERNQQSGRFGFHLGSMSSELRFGELFSLGVWFFPGWSRARLEGAAVGVSQFVATRQSACGENARIIRCSGGLRFLFNLLTNMFFLLETGEHDLPMPFLETGPSFGG